MPLGEPRQRRRQRLRLRDAVDRSTVRHRRYESLHFTARTVIALFQSTDLTEPQVAELMRVSLGELRDFRKLLNSEPDIRAIIDEGLPGIYGEWLPDGRQVVCSTCRNKVRFVPCITCWSMSNDVDPVVDEEDWPDEGKAAGFRPGSPGKIEVMRSRVERGFSPFSRFDTVLAGGLKHDADFGGNIACPPSDDADEGDDDEFEDFLMGLAE